MKELIEQIQKNHKFAPPLPVEQIDEIEKQLGYNLPLDLKEFYTFCNGASLFPDRWGEYAYDFVPLEKMRRVRIDVLGVDEDYHEEVNTTSWYSLCALTNGEFVAVDLSSVKGDSCYIVDCWHEEFGLGSIIALSFTEFLAGALASGGEQYWLKPEAPDYGCIFEREGESD